MQHKLQPIKRFKKQFLFRLLNVFIIINSVAINLCAQQSSNDHIFPPSTEAKTFIDFDSKGFLINGKRTFIVSAGMEYARVPHELWQDRLLRLKRCGFNCIEIYTFWNFHEPREGQFDFSGDHDLDAFLKLAKKMGMYVIARVGPYYCAEWESGGYPIWLRFKPNLRVREHNAEFEKYTGRFFDKLLPIVSKNQINRGGSVILVQLENEHTQGWGTFMPNKYFHFLQSKALSLGIEVPYFFSGLHHASDPAEDGNFDDPKRPNPWFTTEYWSVWFTGYSSTDSDARVYARRTWKIIANGGNGYNYYMAHGGSNFGYTNNDEDAASYDYGAAVGQCGDLRPIYYSFKRTALFARSFQDILENSTNANSEYKNFVSDTAIHITARKSPAGEIIFLDNPAASSVLTQMHIPNNKGLPETKSIKLQAGEIFPVVHHFKLNRNTELQWSFARILAITKQNNTTTIVVYGEIGHESKMYFTVSGKPLIANNKNTFSINKNQIELTTIFDEMDKPTEYSFSVGNETVHVLAVNEKLADRTWFVDNNEEKYIICGPSYASDLKVDNGKIALVTEQPWLQKENHDVWIFSSTGSKKLHAAQSIPSERKNLLALSPWQIQNIGEEAAMPDMNDSDWKESKDPLQMGADGDLSADAWYRTNINIDTNGTYSLQVDGGDRATGFIDGKIASSGNIKDGELTFNIEKGKHTLAIFTAHDGRDKLAGYMGAIDSVDTKGIFGKASLVSGSNHIQTVNGWKFLRATSVDDVKNEPSSNNITGWEDYTIGNDVFNLQKGFGWFRATLNDPPMGVSQIQLKFRSVDENATVFINNTRLTKHDGWNSPFSVMIDHADTLQKPLTLTLFIENYSNEGGIDRPVKVNYLMPSINLTGWRMHGGPNELTAFDKWITMDENMQSQGPRFFSSTFELPASNGHAHPEYRVTTQGLGHGSVWVNGHNLGRYPEKIPVNGLYIPECWMKPGKNMLLIFDEDGKLPTHVTIEAETAASRDIRVFSNF